MASSSVADALAVAAGSHAIATGPTENLPPPRNSDLAALNPRDDLASRLLSSLERAPAPPHALSRLRREENLRDLRRVDPDVVRSLMGTLLQRSAAVAAAHPAASGAHGGRPHEPAPPFAGLDFDVMGGLVAFARLLMATNILTECATAAARDAPAHPRIPDPIDRAPRSGTRLTRRTT